MITIEVLIALLILFLVITTSSLTIKHLFFIQRQQRHHEERYAALLSIRDRLEIEGLCRSRPEMEGEWDGFHYRAVCSLLKELRSFQYADEDTGHPEGNTGRWLVRLYRVDLTLGRAGRVYPYHYEKSVAIDTLGGAAP